MKAVSGNNGVIFFASLVFMMHSSQLNAGCSRDDVEYYLAKNFSNDQITVLCSAPSTTGNAVSHSQSQNTEQSSSTATADENELFLKTAIKAKNITMDSDYLSYTQKICIEYGDEDLYGFTPKVCPDVKFTITLKDLEVFETGKRYGFYGTMEVRVKSTIKRKIIGDLNDQKQEDRELILGKFEQGDKTAIPIRDDFSLEKVKQVLQQLSD